MRLPSFIFNTDVVIRLAEGNGAFGPVYAGDIPLDSNVTLNSAVELGYLVSKARVTPETQYVRDTQGNEIVATATALLPYDAEITAESIVYWNGTEYLVISVKTVYGLKDVSHLEVALR